MKTRYSKYIFPILIVIDLIIINGVLLFYFYNEFDNILFSLYLSISWIISSLIVGYYKVFRSTNFYKVLSLIFKQSLIFTLIFYAYFGVFKEGIIVNKQLKTILLILTILLIFKVLFFVLIKNYRKIGRNYRNVLFYESDKNTQKIISLFNKRKYLGYKVQGFFSDQKYLKKSQLFLGSKKDIFDYTSNNNIDEIYITLSKTTREEVKSINKFTIENKIQLKLIPNPNELFSKNQQAEVFEDNFKVLTIKKLPFEFYENRLIKRLFDISFSLTVILLLMSWLIPILWILIKIESKGPLFFKQEREGLNGKRFLCYKFRSMKLNKEANKESATKNDLRITKIGAFIRKTSIDELPQFFNVFLGDMSIVGPRPHMNLHSVQFEKEIKNYVKRHAVKPGITGLAQIKGYRGEIIKKSDIENRVRLDIFYIENWSFLFDLKIIINTVLNVFKGEEKAY